MRSDWPVCSLLGVLCACGRAETAPTVVVRDSAGIEIVFSPQPLWIGKGGAWTLDSIPALELATDPDNPVQTLFNVGDVELLSDGRVVVANAGSEQLLVFDSATAFLGAWGREGGGPGEFTGMNELVRCAGDTLMVRERARMSVLDAQGAFVRAETVAGRLATSAFTLEEVSRDCSSVLLSVRHGRPPEGPGERLFTYPTHVYWAPLDGSPPISVDSFPGNEVMTVDVGVLAGARVPFGVEPAWASDGEEVFYGPADRFEVHVFGRDGRLVRIIRWGAQVEPIAERDWARYEEWRRLMIEEDPAGSLMPARDEHPSPDVLPTLSDVLVDDEGNLWVQRYVASLFEDVLPPEEPERWWVFDAGGRWLGEVAMPMRFVLRSVERGHAIGIATDALDVPSVRLFGIRKAGAAGGS